MRTAVVLGSSGLVGGRCLEALRDRPEYERIIAVARRPLPSPSRPIEQSIADFDHLERYNSAPGADIYCAIGTTIRKAGSQDAFRKVDFEYPKRFAERALAAGSKCFILVSSVGADPRSRNFYLRVKGEVEQAISEMAFEAIHIFRPSLLLGPRAERRPAEKLAIPIAKALAPLMLGSMRKYRPVTAATVAKLMVAAALANAKGVHIHQPVEA